jgi:hypothetical protein
MAKAAEPFAIITITAVLSAPPKMAARRMELKSGPLVLSVNRRGGAVERMFSVPAHRSRWFDVGAAEMDAS